MSRSRPPVGVSHVLRGISVRWGFRRSPVDAAFWRQTLCAAAIAERSMAIIDTWGNDRMRRKTPPILDAIWDGAALGRRPVGRDPRRMLERLGGREAESNRAIYAAVEALESLYVAAWMGFKERPYERDPGDVGAEVFAGLDGIIHFAHDPRPVFIDPRNPPPPGRFEAREEQRVARDRSIALTSATLEELAGRLRDQARRERTALHPEIAEALKGATVYGHEW